MATGDRSDDRSRSRGRGPVDPRVEAPATQRRTGNVVGDPLLTGSAPLSRRPIRPPARPAATPRLPEAPPAMPAEPVAAAPVEAPAPPRRDPDTAPVPEVVAAPVTVAEPPEAAPFAVPAAHAGNGNGRVEADTAAVPVVEPAPEPEARATPLVDVPDLAPHAPVPIADPTAAVPAVAPVVVPAPVPDAVTTRAHQRTEIPRVSRRVRWRARRPRVRKVSRVVRRIDPWTVLKISVIFWLLAYVILLVAGVLLWNLANTTGTVGNIEGFIKDLFGLETFAFDGQRIFRASWVLGAVLAVAGTGLNLVVCVLFNLIADLVGGVRVTVLEEEVVLRERPVGAPTSKRPPPV